MRESDGPFHLDVIKGMGVSSIGVGVEPTRGNLLLELERRSNTGPGFRLIVDVDVDAVRVERSGATCSSKYYYSPFTSCVLRLI